ncbi:MAG: hypothetical protein K1Y36_07670 [Blastocatellia bacterium]|nr:hypothetical protein [Blastocatellia bacterium]
MKLKQTLRCVFFVLGIGVLLWSGRPIQADRPAQPPVPHLTNSPSPQATVGELELISKAAPGQTSNAVELTIFYQDGEFPDYFRFSSNDDGRFIAFASQNTTIVPGQADTPNSDDVFLADRQTGVVTLVSHSILSPVQAANRVFNLGGFPIVSGDGRYVVFLSDSTDLVAGVTYPVVGVRNLYLYDRMTGTNTLVSRSAVTANAAANGTCNYKVPVKISTDGRYIAFVSDATDLVSGQSDSQRGFHVFLFDRVTGVMALVDHTAASLTTSGDGNAGSLEMTPDGQSIVFSSSATNLVPGQNSPPNSSHVFVYNRATQATMLVSRASGSPAAANGSSRRPKISTNGQIVVFESYATNLVSGFSDTNGVNGSDIFRADLSTGITTLVSHIPSSASTTGNGDSILPEISADGSVIVYQSQAGNLVPGQLDGSLTNDVFLFNHLAGTTTLVSHAPGNPVMSGAGTVDQNYPLALSRDGKWVAYEALSTSNLVAGQVDQRPDHQTPQVFVFDRLDGTNRLGSHKYGVPATTGYNRDLFPPLKFAGATSLVLFAGDFLDLTTPPFPSNAQWLRLFGFDAQSGQVSIESHRSSDLSGFSISGNGGSLGIKTSVDGRYVVFTSYATNLVSLPTGTPYGYVGNHLFLADRATGMVTLVSHATGLPTTTANHDAIFPSQDGMSRDGRYIVFSSFASNLVEGQTDSSFSSDIFLYDRLTATTRLVSHQANSATTAGNGGSDSPCLSLDGRFLVFNSQATDLVSGVTYPTVGPNTFLYNIDTGTTTLVSHAAGSPVMAANGATANASPVISADGSTVAFVSTATNLVTGQPVTNHLNDVFAYSVANQTIVLASRPAFPQSTVSGLNGSLNMSRDGNWLAFVSSAGNLIAGQNTSNKAQVFLFNRAANTTQLVSHIPAAVTTGGNDTCANPSMSVDGGWIAFHSRATDLISGQVDTASTDDVFVFDRATGNVMLVSHPVGSSSSTATGSFPVISQSGTAIAFLSTAPNLVAGQVDDSITGDLFLFDRTTGVTSLVSHEAGFPLKAAGKNTYSGGFSSSENILVFSSGGSSLVANDGNETSDVFVAPLGLVNLNFPTVNPAVGVTRQQGSTGTNSVLAAVSDVETLAGALPVAVTAPTGISVTGLTNNGGTVSATITAACGAPLGSNSLILRVTDGDGNITSTAVTVTITANTPPTVGSYQAVNVALGSPTTVTPSAPPTDNGTVATVTVAASAGFSGPLTVNPATGMVSFTAGLEGTFTITVTATDNCGSTTQQTFAVTVLPFGKGPVINSLSPISGPAGTAVTISGLNLTGVTQVTFNGRPAAFTVNAATQITATVPIGAATGPVAVAGPNGAATGPVFTVIRTK